MKRIYACIAIVAVLLNVAFYSSWKVQSFADGISAALDPAAEAIRNADYPAARQALADGADRCDQMRTKMNHLLRTADFTELEAALRTELLAHTGTGAVYVYDPAARTVEQVVGGIAGASGLALDERTQTLYISDLGSRCIWSAAASAHGLTAGGKGCQSSFSGLPGYPGALALDEDSTLYISYRWASSSWLERHAGSTFLRGVALRLSESMQENLFSLPADGIRAEAVSTASGSWLWSFSGKPQGSSSALCPVENRVYFGIAGEKALYSVRI